MIDAGNPLFIAWAIVTAVLFAGQLIESVSVLIFGPGRKRGGFFPHTYRVFVFGWIAAFCVFAATIAYAPQAFDAFGITQGVFALYLLCAVVAAAVVSGVIEANAVGHGGD